MFAYSHSYSHIGRLDAEPWINITFHIFHRIKIAHGNILFDKCPPPQRVPTGPVANKILQTKDNSKHYLVKVIRKSGMARASPLYQTEYPLDPKRRYGQTLNRLVQTFSSPGKIASCMNLLHTSRFRRHYCVIYRVNCNCHHTPK